MHGEGLCLQGSERCTERDSVYKVMRDARERDYCNQTSLTMGISCTVKPL